MPPRKIKILYVINGLKLFAGTEKHLYKLISNLDRTRFECHVLPITWKEELIKEFKSKGAVDHIYGNGYLKRIYDWHGLRFMLWMYNIIVENKFDIIQTFQFHSDVVGAIIGRLAGVPIIISGRRDTAAFKSRSKVYISRITNHLTDYFIAVCNDVYKTVKRMEGIPEKKMCVIYNGINMQEMKAPEFNQIMALKKSLRIDDGDFVVGNVSILRPEKGHDVFFSAMKKLALQIPQLKILVVGTGPRALQEKYQEEVQQKQELIGRVIFTGYVHNVHLYISLMDVACLTPICNEGFSNAILEEMTLSKPVVATDVGGNAEAVLDGKTGYIVPPDDPDRLAEAILRLYREPSLRFKMGMEGRKRVEQYFPLEKMIQETESLYVSLTNGKLL